MSARNSYDKGDKIRVTGTFVTAAGVAVDPTSVYGQYITPAGVQHNYVYGGAEMTKSGSGVYYFDVSADESGEYFYRVAGSGTAQACAEGSFTVKRSRFAV